MSMAHVAVAMNAREHFAVGVGWQHLVHDVGMTIEARVPSHPPVPRLDLNGLMKILQREGQRMKEAVVGLGNPLAHWMMGKVTVVADGHMAMA
jgi:hypothetical protein